METPIATSENTENIDGNIDARKVINRIDNTLKDVSDDVQPVIEVEKQLDSPLISAKEFTDFGLDEKILEGVYTMEYKRPSKIQGLAIPIIIANPPQNFIGQSQSGTGKTAAFLLGMFARVDQSKPDVQAVCVAPTRELARQIFDVAQKLAQFTQIKIALAIPDEKVVRDRKFTEQVVIGTPGKIFYFISHNNISFNNLKMFVLDEADEMLDLQGQREQTLKIQKKIPKDCQVCLFSATYNNEIKEFAHRIVPSPKTSILIPPEKLTLDGITQLYIICQNEKHKYSVLHEIYALFNVGQSIIFTESRNKAKDVYAYLETEKHEVSLLTGGDMPPAIRDQVIDDFRKGINRILVTTNVLSRGVDVFTVSLVINFDLPVIYKTGQADPESYLHRIGRSGRYGNSGIAINLVHDLQSKQVLENISDYFHKPVNEIKVEHLDQLEDPAFKK